ncbi:MAG: T9SS type A sorting domain-containing protein [Saprospiraceae bacterium]|uniref:T9SS type A sorting domain-containing protein n=1 Tax=Candidatus Opimibacter skivensis TaxID=2982028 RepID=A0A9D7SWS3_9BACT|nr:T9SS type A sorting domain-containing protein [Candidatus Opimibacter skivensis]
MKTFNNKLPLPLPLQLKLPLRLKLLLPLLLPLLFLSTYAFSQSMRWIPATDVFELNPCPHQQASKTQALSYVLEYTPGVSGVLTSYTTGFLISCTTAGSAIVKNQSVVMTNKSREISGCNTMGAVLMNSSGNSGDAVHNTITAGVPVILHQICLSIPEGEAVTILEEEVTDLTTSIDVGNGDPVTEFPTYAPISAGRAKYDQGKPMLLLDFKGVPLEDFVAQLDWSTSLVINNTHFDIERSTDGVTFSSIGTVEVGEKTDHIRSYQFFDKEAKAGDNYYRLMQVNPQGTSEYSPVRIVNFTPKTFAVTCTPNPADDFLQLDIQSPVGIKNITLTDASGRIVMDEKDDNNNFNTRLDVKKLLGGIYTLTVVTTTDRYTEKVVIAH